MFIRVAFISKGDIAKMR